MSVVAMYDDGDNIEISADTRTTWDNGPIHDTISKLVVANGNVIGVTGHAFGIYILRMMARDEMIPEFKDDLEIFAWVNTVFFAAIRDHHDGLMQWMPGDDYTLDLLIANKHGVWALVNMTAPLIVKDSYYAMGLGAAYAIGALETMDAYVNKHDYPSLFTRRAVETAANHITTIGGSIETYMINKKSGEIKEVS